SYILSVFLSTETATNETYTLSLHDALPIWVRSRPSSRSAPTGAVGMNPTSTAGSRIRSHGVRKGSSMICGDVAVACLRPIRRQRSEEHTSELQSRENLVCRLLLEKKNTITI